MRDLVLRTQKESLHSWAELSLSSLYPILFVVLQQYLLIIPRCSSQLSPPFIIQPFRYCCQNIINKQFLLLLALSTKWVYMFADYWLSHYFCFPLSLQIRSPQAESLCECVFQLLKYTCLFNATPLSIWITWESISWDNFVLRFGDGNGQES